MILSFPVIMKALSCGLRGKCQHVQPQCEWVQSSLLFILDQSMRARLERRQTYSQEGTQTPPAAQYYNFSPALGHRDPFQKHPERLQDYNTFATKKRQELKACPALTTLRDNTSTEVASATDASLLRQLIP